MLSFEPCLDKCDALHDQIQTLRPLSQSELAQLKAYYSVGLTYSSNALEGNSLTETETKVVIEDGLTISGKPMRDHFEALGHHEAFISLYESLKGPIDEKIVLGLHRLFYKRLDEAKAGMYRSERIIVSGSSYRFPSPESVPDLMNAFIKALPQKAKDLHPILFASYIHRECVTIHPFVDGNGRTARLLMNLVLLKHGFPVTIIPPLYRQHYIDMLKEAQINQNTDSFDIFIMNMVLEAQKDYIRMFG